MLLRRLLPLGQAGLGLGPAADRQDCALRLLYIYY